MTTEGSQNMTDFSTVKSADGTVIAYERHGQGPAVVLVDGALSVRGGKAGLDDLLGPEFTVYRYDRRGRGDSGDTLPYAPEREAEDLAAVIEAAGGTAFLYGHSSGCALVLDAAIALGPGVVPKIALYEAPYSDDPADQPRWTAYLADLAALLAEDRRGDAVALFMKLVGMPADQVDQMRQAPWFPAMEAIAPTLAYDHAGLMGPVRAVPVAKASQVSVPALVMYGGDSVAFMRAAAQGLSQAIPGAELREIGGQQHDVAPGRLAPVLAPFLAA
ncbi:MAG TPA: alpha/beta hydrolase [Streptosporangiaceae bacterium]|nr:alpha/beta hydrolase [Streptosporangiaceae bacterium]